MALKKWAVTIIGCAVVLGILAFVKVSQITAAIAAFEAYPEQSETVEMAIVRESLYSPEITVLGEMTAPQRLDLRNEIEGEITAVNFESGDRIHQGQVLIQLDTAVEEANLAAAQARAELAQQVFDRAENLFNSNVSSRDQLDRARADLTAANADIRALERTIEKKTLTAPFDGKAGLHDLEVGQYMPSNTLITTLVGDSDFIWVDFQVPQFYPRLTAGTQVDIAAINNNPVTDSTFATVVAENTILNASNRSRSYRASLNNADGEHLAHTMVKVQVPTAASRTLLQVPDVAIQNNARGQFIYKLLENEGGQGYRAARQSVELVLIEDGHALIETGGGLMTGDRIAAAGAFKLYEGILVYTRERSGISSGISNGTSRGMNDGSDPVSSGDY